MSEGERCKLCGSEYPEWTERKGESWTFSNDPANRGYCPGLFHAGIRYHDDTYPAPPGGDEVKDDAKSWPCICRPAAQRENVNKTIEVVPASQLSEAVERAERAEARLAALEGPHILVLSADRWTIEHSLACRESGRMAECDVHERVAAWIDRMGEPDLPRGRYEIGDGPLPTALANLNPDKEQER